MRFATTIELAGKTATGFEVPAQVVDELGSGKRPAVTVTVGGHRYPSTVAVMGGRFMVPLSAENRTAAGLAAGDEVEAELVLDTAPRELVVPDDLAAAIAADAAAQGSSNRCPTRTGAGTCSRSRARRPTRPERAGSPRPSRICAPGRSSARAPPHPAVGRAAP